MESHNLEVGKIEPTKIGGKFNHNALCLAYQDKKIINIPLTFLQYDVSPVIIKNHMDFVNLMNELVLRYKGFQGKNELNTIKRIIWFQNTGYF